MAEGFQGKDLLLKLGATLGTLNSGYVPVGGMRTTSLSINSDIIDVTNKSNMPWRQIIAGGVQSVSLSAAGVWNDDTVLQSLMTIFMAGSIVYMQITSGEGDTFTGLWKMTKFERAGDYKGEETYSISIESAGIVTFVDL